MCCCSTSWINLCASCNWLNSVLWCVDISLSSRARNLTKNGSLEPQAVAISGVYGLQKPQTLWQQTVVFPPPSAKGFLPSSLVLGGGSIIHLRGKNMVSFARCDRLSVSVRNPLCISVQGEMGVESIQCEFGHGKSLAYTVSSTLSVCEVPAGTLPSMVCVKRLFHSSCR